MKILHVSIFSALLACSPFLLAQSSKEVTTTPGAAKTSQTVMTTATVTGIDPATRTISLKRADGKIVDVHAGEEVRNFDKIKVGDTVTTKHTQALSLDLKKNSSGIRERSESTSMTRAPAGAQPGGTVSRQVTVVADVVAVDKQDKMVTLRGPQDHVVDLKVADSDQLNRIKQGDQVRAVYTEALAVAVEPASTSSGK